MSCIIDKVYQSLVLFIGAVLFTGNLFFLKGFVHPDILTLLLLLAWICEHYYIPTNTHRTSMILPFLFALTVIWSLPIAILIIGLVLVLDFVSFRNKDQNTLFYSSSLIISLCVAAWVSDYMRTIIYIDRLNWKGMFIWSLTFSISFFILKYGLNYGRNLVIGNRTLKKDPYQIYWEAAVITVSFLYCCIFLIVGHQNRGKIDVLSYFFFFSPIVAFSLLCSFTSRLQKERRRLKSVFTLTTLVNSGITAEDPIKEVVVELRKLISIDASILWLNENEKWEIFHRYGRVSKNILVTEELKDHLLHLDDILTSNKNCPVATFFEDKIQTIIYAPLRVEGDLIGVWAVGSDGKNIYSKVDYHTFITLANQIAAIAKTRRLVRQQENHKILEERNRIAREIHDGIAQTIAGAIMDLDSVDKSFYTHPEKSHQLVKGSVKKLRSSLGQVRSSILALRPHLTERIGLVEAIEAYTKIFEEENPNLSIRYLKKGQERPLGVYLEKGILDIFREGLRNIEKHASATKVTILLGYFNEEFCLYLKDNGTGFSLGETLIRARTSNSFGILNMNELSEQLGGTLDIQSRKGEGTKIVVTIPYKGEKEVKEHG